MERAKVFEETYQRYLGLIGDVDYLEKADVLGAKRKGDSLAIPFYDTEYLVSAESISDVDGNVADVATRVILGKYVLTCESFIPNEKDELKNYRDFRDSTPLISYFTTNAIQPIEERFAGKPAELEQCCLELGGIRQQAESYDLSFLFFGLPRIPVLLNFNDRDDLFPAACSLLFKSSAEQFIDMECLAIVGVSLARKLCR